jgi:hypothetical protein
MYGQLSSSLKQQALMKGPDFILVGRTSNTARKEK